MRARWLNISSALCAACIFALPIPSLAVTGLVGAWGLNGVSGTPADYSGNNNRGEGTRVAPTAGRFGSALVFDGTDAFGTGALVDLGNPGVLQLTGSMTVSAWINSAAFPVDDAAIVSSFNEIAGRGFQLDTTVDTGPRTIGFKLHDPNGDLMIRYGATALGLDQWVHVAGVYDAQAQTMNVYLNGVLDNGTLLGTVSSSQRNALTSVLIGQRADWTQRYAFIGTIDEMRIYNRALTQAEIQADMNSSAGGPPPDTTPPSAPTGLSATAVSTSQINLTWTASTDNVGVTGYRVERCQGAGCANFLQIAAPTATSFNDTGLAAASYSYRVRAADATGNLSAYSNVASATTVGATQVQGYYIHTDHLNTPRLIANQQGATVWKWDQQEPFGSTPPNDNPSGLGAFDFPLRLPGQYYDRETALHYNMFRDYDPSIGRYVESDPIGLDGGLNTYAYVRSSPLLAIDLYGLASPNPCDLAKALPKPDDDPCNCQRDVLVDLCKCYKDDPFNIIGRGICVERAYLKKSKCIQNCVPSACKGGHFA